MHVKSANVINEIHVKDYFCCILKVDLIL